jgi:hypothetical protein
MKQKDIALIAVIVIISGVISIFVSKALFAPPSSKQKVEVVESISPSFPTPETTYFNAQSVDPTQLIQIGNNNNSAPFNGTSGSSQ